jgi:hypothetical protein
MSTRAKSPDRNMARAGSSGHWSTRPDCALGVRAARFGPNGKQGLVLAYLGAGLSLLVCTRVWAVQPVAEIVIPPVIAKIVPLPPEAQKRVNDAISGGVAYLRRSQAAEGSFGDGVGVRTAPAATRWWPVAFAALPGLTLLESGVAGDDPAVLKAARFVRAHIPTQTRTYEIALALLFLDRLGAPGDVPLVRSLALRLVAGQTSLGGWGYHCPLLTPAQEQKLLEGLRKQKWEDTLRPLALPKTKGPTEPADNSNTQFAILALWTARKHELPLEYTLARIEQRFRSGQRSDGWDYRLGPGRPNGSMTCVGLLGLAVGRGSAQEPPPAAAAGRDKPEDQGIASGLRALGACLNDPTDFRGEAGTTGLGPKGAVNLYFLWSVERVGVLCNVHTIGGKDWYRWGVDLLLPTQRPDGSWLGRGNGGSPVIDTSMALLFLKRSDLLPDLRETLQKRLTITDPGPDLKHAIQKKTGDKLDLKKGIQKKNAPSGTDDAPLIAKLGDVKLKEATQRPLRVRGPAAFRITGMRGDDDELRISMDSQSREVHELTLTLRPNKAGEFQRIIYLLTDIPGRAEVAVQIQARVVAEK